MNKLEDACIYRRHFVCTYTAFFLSNTKWHAHKPQCSFFIQNVSFIKLGKIVVFKLAFGWYSSNYLDNNWEFGNKMMTPELSRQSCEIRDLY